MSCKTIRRKWKSKNDWEISLWKSCYCCNLYLYVKIVINVKSPIIGRSWRLSAERLEWLGYQLYNTIFIGTAIMLLNKIFNYSWNEKLISNILCILNSFEFQRRMLINWPRLMSEERKKIKHIPTHIKHNYIHNLYYYYTCHGKYFSKSLVQPALRIRLIKRSACVCRMFYYFQVAIEYRCVLGKSLVQIQR